MRLWFVDLWYMEKSKKQSGKESESQRPPKVLLQTRIFDNSFDTSESVKS